MLFSLLCFMGVGLCFGWFQVGFISFSFGATRRARHALMMLAVARICLGLGAVPAVRGDAVSGLQEPTPRLAFARKNRPGVGSGSRSP